MPNTLFDSGASHSFVNIRLVKQMMESDSWINILKEPGVIRVASGHEQPELGNISVILNFGSVKLPSLESDCGRFRTSL